MGDERQQIPTQEDIGARMEAWVLRVWEFARQPGLERVTADVHLHEGFRTTVTFESTPDGEVVIVRRPFGFGPKDRRLIVRSDGSITPMLGE